jgi:hypothetical protein
MPTTRRLAKSKCKPIKFLQQILQNPSLKSQTSTPQLFGPQLATELHGNPSQPKNFHINQVLHHYNDTQVILHI